MSKASSAKMPTILKSRLDMQRKLITGAVHKFVEAYVFPGEGKLSDISVIFKRIVLRKNIRSSIALDPLSAYLTKWSNTLKQFVGSSRRIV